jgi:hypothetical protein
VGRGRSRLTYSKIFSPLREAAPARVLRSMKSLQLVWPSPVVMAVCP